MARRYYEPKRDYRKSPLPGRKDAIEVKCLDCCANDWATAKACTIYTCPLWKWGLAGKARRRGDADGE